MSLIYDEIIALLDLKYIPSKRTGFSLYAGIYELSDLNQTINYVLPNKVKVNITNDDIRLKSNSNNNQTSIFTKNVFFLHNFRF